jgi:hypothetical protein
LIFGQQTNIEQRERKKRKRKKRKDHIQEMFPSKFQCISSHVLWPWRKIACLDAPSVDDDEYKRRERMDPMLILLEYGEKSPIHKFLITHHAKSVSQQQRLDFKNPILYTCE